MYEEVEDEEMEDTNSNSVPQNSSREGHLKLSNLEYTVTEDDLRELFQTVGQLKKVSIKYDKSGRSEGEADVIFNNFQDAKAALKKYQGVTIDKKEVKIELVSSQGSSRRGGAPRNSFRGRSRGRFGTRG
jgi:RNA recognition motif-containing protein